jgi:hypothetical protein
MRVVVLARAPPAPPYCSFTGVSPAPAAWFLAAADQRLPARPDLPEARAPAQHHGAAHRPLALHPQVGAERVRAWPCRQPASAGICLCRAWSVAHRCVNRRRFASKLEFEDRTHAVAMTAVRLVGQVNSVFVFFQCRD